MFDERITNTVGGNFIIPYNKYYILRLLDIGIDIWVHKKEVNDVTDKYIIESVTRDDEKLLEGYYSIRDGNDIDSQMDHIVSKCSKTIMRNFLMKC